MGNQCTCVLTQIFIHPGVHLHPVDKKQDGILTGADIFEKTNMYVCLEGAYGWKELMAAQQELAPRHVRNRNKDTERSRDGDGRVPRCGSWNTWETKGTCEWESKNPGEKCNRLHECTYCKTKKFKPVNHQRLFCPKRLAAGTD